MLCIIMHTTIVSFCLLLTQILDYKGERKLAPLIKYVEQHMDGTAPVEEEEGEEEPPEDEEPPEEEGVEEEEDTHDEL